MQKKLLKVTICTFQKFSAVILPIWLNRCYYFFGNLKKCIPFRRNIAPANLKKWIPFRPNYAPAINFKKRFSF